MMRSFGVFSWAIIGLVAVIALAENKNDNRQNPPVKPETEQEALAEAVFQVSLLQHCLATNSNANKNRAKRSTYQYSRSYNYNNGNAYNNGFENYLDMGLGFRRYDYGLFPNVFNYNARFANFYPQDLRLNLYRLPVARFFNSFYPGPIVRPAGDVVDRTYFRVGSFENALSDFHLFPLTNVRTLTTRTTSVQADAVPGYVGTFRDFPYEVQVCNDCCQGGFPCIRFTGQTYPFQRVTRNYVYVRNSRSVSSYNPYLV